MGKPLDLTGQQFGRLTVDDFAGTMGDTRSNRKRYWYCTCECGNETLVSTGDLRAGRTQSCGCLNAEAARDRKLKHGGCLNRRQQGTSAEFAAWHNLRNREIDYPDRWNDFQQFFRDVGWRPDDKYVIGRYDLTQPHGPENTYWRNPDDERQLRINTDLGSEFLIDMSAVRDAYAFSGTTDQA